LLGLIVGEIGSCKRPFSFAEFFKDTPWLSIPADREAVLIAPLYPRGGLLGGASDGVPKMSKLQALAAARKKKAQDEKSGGGSVVERPMAVLNIGSDEKPTETVAPKPGLRSFPIRKRKDSNPHEKSPTKPQHIDRSLEIPSESEPVPALDQAPPSAFASTMFSSTFQPQRQPENLFTLPYTATVSSPVADPFAGPSPDDVVIAAQSKGSTNSIRTQK
jgi:elongation factor 1 alpha-like protein